MIASAIDVLLVVAVVAAWLGSFGFARLRAPLDRLHCTTFVNATSGTALMLAAFLDDGVSNRACKISLTIAISLVAGAAMSHAVGRSVQLRRESAEADRQAGTHG